MDSDQRSGKYPVCDSDACSLLVWRASPKGLARQASSLYQWSALSCIKNDSTIDFTEHFESLSGQEILSQSSKDVSIPKLSTKEQEELLRACSVDIEGILDLEQIRCHLYQHKLLSDSDCSTLQAPDFELSRKTKIQMLIKNLPRKGSDALDRFVKCLVNSADGTGHGELARIIYKTVKERARGSQTSDDRHVEISDKKMLIGCKCVKYTTTILVVLIAICSLIYVLNLYWPTFMYHLNLDVHSKSLPYLSQNFFGREKEMKEVSRLLDFRDSDVRIVNIYGSPGFGKSTLAIHVGHEMVKFGVTVHYVNMDDLPDKDVKTALAEKVLEASHIISKNITFERLLRWARECYSRTLVILDNCDDLLHKNKEEFHQAIERIVEESLNVKSIMTSRKVASFLMYFEHYKIKELSSAASFRLLDHKVASLSHEEKEQIANLTGNVPLALQIIGSILHLPDSPSLTALIGELKNELIQTLSPTDFPVNKQVFTTISLSYKYLPKELQRIGCQLTVFPGSFTLLAAFTVFNNGTEIFYNQFVSTEQTKKFGNQLKSLVRNSLLEYSQRTDRYQYHRLIKEYFLLIQKRHWSNEISNLLLAFNMYYSKALMVESGLFEYRHDYEKSLAFLDSEQHNLEYLFENLKQMQSISSKKLDIQVFLMTTTALSVSFHANFLQVRFSGEKCCILLKSTLNKLDKMMPYLQHYLHNQLLFKVETVMRHYLAIIKQVSKCERETHGIQEAILVYSIRKTIIESKSAVLMPLMYTNFYKELSSLYSQLGKRFKDDTLECYRLIVSRTNAHHATCQPKQCQYYDFGIMYYKMGHYQEACDFFEEELTDSSDVMHKIRTLVQLVYIYSYMEEYNKRNLSIARLQDLYYDIAAIPPDELILGSDAALMFIQFYRVGELVNEAQWLENQLVRGLQNLESKVRTAFRIKWKIKDQKSLLDTAYKVLNNFFEAGNYSLTAEVGSILIRQIEKSDSLNLNDTKIELHLLVGKAKFHMGQYSDGMDHIELALQSIPNINGSYEEERNIACWYLIPRITYIDTCYWIKWNLMMVIVTPVVAIVGTGLFFIFSPIPFYYFNHEEGLFNNKFGEKPILTLHQLSPSTALATKTTSLNIVNKCSKWFVIIQHQATEALSRVNTFFELIKGLLKLSFIKSTRDLLYFTMSVLCVWIKLMFIYTRIRWFQQPRIVDYHFSHYAFYGFAVFQVLLTLRRSMSFGHAKTAVRTICDPRYRYGEDGTPHSIFLDAWS